MYSVVIKNIDDWKSALLVIERSSYGSVGWYKHMTVSYLCKLLVSEKCCQPRTFFVCFHGDSSVPHGTAGLLDSPLPPTFEANRQKGLPMQLKSRRGGDSLLKKEKPLMQSLHLSRLHCELKQRRGWVGRVALLEQLCPTNIKIAK